MRMYFIIGLLLISHLGLSQQDGFVEIKTELESKERWKLLEKVLESKRIVALGESLHGVKEYNSTKLELIKYLHEELGFNVLALESDVAKNYFGNFHKLEIADTLFLKELFTPPWHTEEHLEIVKYIKSKPKLKIIGFDIETKKDVNEISKELNVSIDGTANQVKVFLEEYGKWKELNGMNRAASVSERDSTMAEVLIWIISDLYPDEKIIVSAHNTHISNVEIRGACMGEILKDNYRDQYYSIGFFHSLGNPTSVLRKVIFENEKSKLPVNSIQSKFLKTGKSKIFVDIKSQQQENNWLFEELENVWVVNRIRRTIFKMNLAESFDGIIWIKEVTHPKYIIPNKYLEK